MTDIVLRPKTELTCRGYHFVGRSAAAPLAWLRASARGKESTGSGTAQCYRRAVSGAAYPTILERMPRRPDTNNASRLAGGNVNTVIACFGSNRIALNARRTRPLHRNDRTSAALISSFETLQLALLPNPAGRNSASNTDSFVECQFREIDTAASLGFDHHHTKTTNSP